MTARREEEVDNKINEIDPEFPELLYDVPVVQDSKRVGACELVYVDGELARVLAWNSIPTFFVQLLKEDAPKEVEPWRIKKIEKDVT